MNKNARWKLLFVVIIILAGAYALYPTYRLYFGLSDEAFAELPRSEQDALRGSALTLGLDLQGGMDLLLEVDMSEVQPDVSGGMPSSEEVMERALSVLRNRVDEFGVAEPIIQKAGADRIIVQLPGLTDPERARSIVQRVARLEFVLQKEQADVDRTLRTVDRSVALYLAGLPAEAAADSAAVDSLVTESPVLSKYLPLAGNQIAFVSDDVDQLQQWFDEANIDERLPNARLLWAKDETTLADGRRVRELHVLDRKIQLSGEGIKRALVRLGQEGGPEVDLYFSTAAAATFARVTGANVGRQLAIVLDDKVASAPVVRGRISGGRATISGGNMDAQEASDLKIVLEAGALPAPLKVIEERTVGPSLGADSIRQGVRATLIGGAAVAVFMVIYYQLSGFVAVFALIMNLFLLLAVMGRLSATLTLPGIAGIVLTIGMAVDANVLIFERIREEMKLGKTVAASVSRGFEQAFTAIFDANLTTLIAAIVLLRFGAGPIRGFAVTLAIGIVANLFTAYFVSRMVFDAAANRPETKKLSI